ncbi:MAG: alpha/beta hydrolase [Hyphomicrobiales bacterium]|nr:alpha/beta hydrolase [Hyphomicrobiales bacterium]
MAESSYRYAEVPSEGPRRPLVFAFHGTGGDETQFVPLAKKLWPGAAIVSPRGDVSELGALRFFRRRAEGVYDFDDLKLRQKAMAEFVRAHKQRLSPMRAIGLGYSNGANILAAVTFAAPDLFDELILMHPLVPWTPPDQTGLANKRVLITAGRRDPICPPAQTLALERYFERQGADTAVEWHEGGHEMRPSEIDAVVRWSASRMAPCGVSSS